MPNYNSTLQTNNSSLEEIITQLNNLPDAPETVAQATPAIAVNQTTGLITATATQIAGYVPAGTKSATHQLAFQPAKTITPGTTNQTAVAANTYVGGAVTVAGDANLKAENIVNGKTIFGVTGTATTGGGGDTSIEDGLIAGTATSYTNDRVVTIRSNAFYYCDKLTTVSFPQCTIIGSSAFYMCSNLTTISFPQCRIIWSCAFERCNKLTTISFPQCTTIGSYAFYSCTNLTTISFPQCTTIGGNAFYYCSNLTTVSFPQCTAIRSGAFNTCSNLSMIYLNASRLCTLSNSKAFDGTKITSTTGSIFVPASLVASYKAATNWAYFSNRIFSYNA